MATAEDILREQAQWRKGKTSIVTKYDDEHEKIFAGVAGRGFLSLPGYAYGIVNGLEKTVKGELSELNFKIMSETIERELKQAGIAYDIEYKQKALAWEISKQGLMVAWEEEYAGIKQGMSAEEETLNRLATEVSRREIVLIEGKTAIELQMEAYRKQLAQLDGSMAPYEVQLAQAKMLTAKKKLEIIPILQEIVTKEQELLSIEKDKAAAYSDLMAAEKAAAEKQQLLIPGLQDLANKTENLALLIPNQITIEKGIADEKLIQSDIAKQKADYQVQELDANITDENEKLLLADAKRALEVKSFDKGQALQIKEILDETVYQNDMMKNFETIIQSEKDEQQKVITDKETINATQNQTKLASVTTLDNAEISAARDVNANEIYQMGRVSDIEAASKITAELKHLIG